MVAGFCYITKQGMLGPVNMVGNGISCNGNVFGTAGGAGSFGEIYRPALPSYIMFTFFAFLNPWFEDFVFPNFYRLSKFFMGIHIFQVMILAEIGFFSHL